MQIDSPIAAEVREPPAGERIERVDVATERRQQALLAATRPVGDTASLRASAGIPRPFQRSSRAVERDEAASGRDRVQRGLDHNRIDLEAASDRSFAWVEMPRALESADVCAVDLGERRISSLFRSG